MGLCSQQGPLSSGALAGSSCPNRCPSDLYAERLRQRMPCASAETGFADSENVLVLFETGRYPVAYFPETDISPDSLQRTRHEEVGLTSWYTVRAGEHSVPRGAWQHIDLPACPRTAGTRPRGSLWRWPDGFTAELDDVMDTVMANWRNL